MVAPHPAPREERFSDVGVLTRLALVSDPRRDRLGMLARALPALDLRLARHLTWLRGRDLAVLGYSGWLSFVRERVDWSESWVRDMMRLVRSGLDAVIRDACDGLISLTVAATAPGWCEQDGQAEWLALARVGKLPPRPKGKPRGASSTIEPDDAATLDLWHARRKARLLTGLPLADAEADDRILSWWRDQREDLVEHALAAAPRPAAVAVDLEWGFEDPATSLLGPWRTPASATEAMATLDDIQRARHERVRELGLLYDEVVRGGLHRAWGYCDVEQFCQQTMGLSARSLQRYGELGRTLRRSPELAPDLPLSKVEAIARVANPDTADRWAAVAGRVGVTELEAAVAQIEGGVDSRSVLAAYEAAKAAPTATVGLQAVHAPLPPRLTDRVHPDLPAAARWLLTAVVLPSQRGTGKAKERDHYVCANPECRRLALRNHAHHLRMRSLGGPDTPDNLVCVCPSCHLRLIHPGHVDVERRGDVLIWTFPGRTAWVFEGPLPHIMGPGSSPCGAHPTPALRA